MTNLIKIVRPDFLKQFSLILLVIRIASVCLNCIYSLVLFFKFIKKSEGDEKENVMRHAS